MSIPRISLARLTHLGSRNHAERASLPYDIHVYIHSLLSRSEACGALRKAPARACVLESALFPARVDLIKAKNYGRENCDILRRAPLRLCAVYARALAHSPLLFLLFKYSFIPLQLSLGLLSLSASACSPTSDCLRAREARRLLRIR